MQNEKNTRLNRSPELHYLHSKPLFNHKVSCENARNKAREVQNSGVFCGYSSNLGMSGTKLVAYFIVTRCNDLIDLCKQPMKTIEQQGDSTKGLYPPHYFYT